MAVSSGKISKKNDRIIFVKDYTRDFSLIIEDAWSRGIINIYKKILRLSLPSAVPGVYFMNRGAIEVWDNEETFAVLKDKLWDYNCRHPRFIYKILASFRKHMMIIERFRRKKEPLADSTKLKIFLEIFFQTVQEWLIFDYTAKHSDTPVRIRQACHRLRNREKIWDDADFIIRKTLNFLYPNLSPYTNTILLDEVAAPPPRSVLAKRFRAFVFIPGEFQKITTLSRLPKKYTRFIFSRPSKKFFNNSLRGTTAYGHGRVNGRVRIIRRKDEINNFHRGEILVSPMTTPDYMAIMKQATAVITDEGGITCHAAIVAREIKARCLTGTKIATQVLKTGDWVSVDMDSGVIKVNR